MPRAIHLCLPALAVSLCLGDSLSVFRPMLWLDLHNSPEAGAENFLTAHQALNRLEDRVIPDRLFAREAGWSRFGNVLYRFTKLLALDGPLASVSSTAQHEIFGHGYRAREFGYVGVQYVVNPPSPYGRGGGMTRYRYPADVSLTWDDVIAMDIAGIEANDVFARRQRGRWLASGILDYRGALVYAGNALGFESYVAVTEDTGSASNDILAYLEDVNGKYGRTGPPSEYRLGLKDLKAVTVIGWLDPYTLFSAAGAIAYLWSGRPEWAYPMIRMGRVGWLPGAGYRLTPFGGQYLVENMFVLDARTLIVGVAVGDGVFADTWGVDVETRGLGPWKGFELDAEFHLWSQPREGAAFPATAPLEIGAAEYLTVLSPPLSPAAPIRLAAGLGHKTAGYVPGEPLGSDVLWKAGLGWFF